MNHALSIVGIVCGAGAVVLTLVSHSLGCGSSKTSWIGLAQLCSASYASQQ